MIDQDMIGAVLGDLDDRRLCAPARCKTDDGCVCATAAAIIRQLQKDAQRADIAAAKGRAS